jgi:hypothetical protein
MSEQRHHDLAIHPIEDTAPADLVQRRAVVRRGKWLAFIVVLLLAVGAGRAVVIRHTNASALEASIADLSKVPGLKVLEREKVQLLVNEAKLGDSGLADTASAVRSGRLMRAEKVVVGNFEVK